jgi:hypothetical protein
MTLLAAFLEIADGWRGVFPQSRTFHRVVRQAPGLAGVLGSALPVAHHLDQRRPASRLEREVFSALRENS